VKIAECKISSTGNLSTYQPFTVDVPEITGRHDIYLKFRGDGTGKLFQLKSFRFIGGLKEVTSNRDNPSNPGGLKAFPNPAKAQLTISCSEPFTQMRIMNLNGQVMEVKKFVNAVNTVPYLNHLSSGIYLLEVTTKEGAFCTKLTIP
jgi:hypothetical protein